MAANSFTQEDSYGWTRRKLLDLVDIYKNRPCLYDNTSPGYHNRDERARSWTEIAERMGRDEDEVRAKMKSIRTQYARIIQKGQHPKCKTGFTVSSWWLLPNLSFLDDFIIPRKADSETIKDNDMLDITQVKDDECYQEETEMENGDIPDMIYDNEVPEPEITQPQLNSLTSGQSRLDQPSAVAPATPYQSSFTRRISPISISRPSISHYRSNRLKIRKPLKKVKKDQVQALVSASGTVTRNTEEMSSNLLLKTVLAFAERSSRDDDEDSVFGRYVGNEMRGITDEQAKRIAKMRIQKVLFEAQTGWTETSSEGIYHAPRDGPSPQNGFPAGVVCNTNSGGGI